MAPTIRAGDRFWIVSVVVRLLFILLALSAYVVAESTEMDEESIDRTGGWGENSREAVPAVVPAVPSILQRSRMIDVSTSVGLKVASGMLKDMESPQLLEVLLTRQPRIRLDHTGSAICHAAPWALKFSGFSSEYVYKDSPPKQSVAFHWVAGSVKDQVSSSEPDVGESNVGGEAAPFDPTTATSMWFPISQSDPNFVSSSQIVDSDGRIVDFSGNVVCLKDGAPAQVIPDLFQRTAKFNQGYWSVGVTLVRVMDPFAPMGYHFDLQLRGGARITDPELINISRAIVPTEALDLTVLSESAKKLEVCRLTRDARKPSHKQDPSPVLICSSFDSHWVRTLSGVAGGLATYAMMGRWLEPSTTSSWWSEFLLTFGKSFAVQSLTTTMIEGFGKGMRAAKSVRRLKKDFTPVEEYIAPFVLSDRSSPTAATSGHP